MKMVGLGSYRSEIKTGKEPLRLNGKTTGYKLIDFWKWSSSDLLSNATRGKFAEFIVATAMEIDLNDVREEWGEYDLETKEKIKIEVKTSAYLQSWHQYDYSKIIFSIKKKSENKAKGESDEFIRPSDFYVFCLLNHKDKKTVDPLNMDQWLFYVLPTKNINKIFKEKNSISLKSIEKLTEGIKYNQIKENIINEYRNI